MYATWLLGLLLPGASLAQTIIISGKLIDRATEESLPDATVSVRERSIHILTDKEGYFAFTLNSASSDSITIHINYVGYRPCSLRIAAANANLLISLESGSVDLQEVNIIGSKIELLKANQAISSYSIGPDALNKLPAIGEKDAFRSFQLLPGISASNQSSAGLYIRGSTPDQNLVLYDGIPIYYVDHLHGFFSAFNPGTIKQIELSKGGYSALYGGRVSGLVDISVRDGNKKHFNAEASIGLLSVSGLVEGPISRKSTFLVAARRSWQSPLFTKLFGSVYDANRVQQNGFLNQFSSSYSLQASFYDLNAKFSYQANSTNRLSVSFYTGKDYTNNTSISDIPVFGGVSVINADSIHWGNTGASVQWATKISKTTSLNTVLSRSYYFSRRNNGLQTSLALQEGGFTSVKYGTLEDNRLTESSVNSAVRLRTERNNTIDIGLAISCLSINFSYRQNDTVTVLNQANAGLISSVFVQQESHLFNQKTQVTAGFRLSYYGPGRRVYPEPRLTMIHTHSRSVKVKASSGLFNQFAKQVDRDDVSSRGFWVLSGSTAIKPTSA
ncbi:TonB-dependent receptor [Spirosoma koreense]